MSSVGLWELKNQLNQLSKRRDQKPNEIIMLARSPFPLGPDEQIRDVQERRPAFEVCEIQ